MFKKLKIKTTILIALFLGLALPIVLNTYYLQIKYANDLKNDLIRTQKDVLKALSASLERSIWESTKDSAKNLVYPVFNRKDIIEINIMDSKASTHSFLYFHKEYKYNNTDCTKDKDVVIIENILFKNIKLGSLLMRFSTCKINKQILQQRNSLWIIMAIQFLISFIIIFIITHIKVIRPIKKLMEESNKLAHKNLDKEFIWKRNDELGLLGKSLENTRQSLKELFNKEQESNKNLEIKVQQRTSELSKVNKTLQHTITNLELAQEQLITSEKMALIGKMVSGISHEINTPMGIGVTAATHLNDITNDIKKAYEEDNISEEEFNIYLKESLKTSQSIETNLVKASNLIKSFKKISVDQNIDEAIKINLYEYTKDCINSTHSLFLDSKISIKLIMDKDIIITTYPGSYSQFILILITNSLMHAYTKQQEGVINIKAKIDKNIVLIEYNDNGSGITQKNLKHVFDPFFTTKRGQGGSGLGLNILYNIVTNTLKGNVYCESIIEKGTTFFIKFPIELK